MRRRTVVVTRARAGRAGGVVAKYRRPPRADAAGARTRTRLLSYKYLVHGAWYLLVAVASGKPVPARYDTRYRMNTARAGATIDPGARYDQAISPSSAVVPAGCFPLVRSSRCSLPSPWLAAHRSRRRRPGSTVVGPAHRTPPPVVLRLRDPTLSF